jgi:stage V sporulation protein B
VAADTGSRRGALLIGAAKAWFLVVGLGQNLLLPWAIGQVAFGGYRRALVFVNVLNNVVVAASIQAVSRVVAEADPRDRPATLRRALALHGPIGLALSAAFAASVPLICAFQHAPHLAPTLYALALVPLVYGLYAPLVGALNGARAFGRQAALDATYSTLRTGLSALVGALFVRRVIAGGDGALGTALGFAFAALVILPIAGVVSPLRGAGEARFDRRLYFAVLGGLVVMQLLQSLTLQVDLAALGRAATLAAVARGASELEARRVADALSGLYAQAQAFGLVPYQLLTTASFVLFPSVAEARARGDDEAVRSGVERGGRATLVVAGAIASAIGGAPAALLRFAYGHGGELPIVSAAPMLRALAIAHACTALVALGASLLVAAGRARLAATLAGIAAALAIAATFGASHFAAGAGALPVAPGAPLGVAVASGLALAMVLSLAVASATVRRAIGAYVAPLPFARVALAAGAAIAVGAFVPTPASRLLCALVPLVPLALYLAVVALLGEPIRALITRPKK